MPYCCYLLRSVAARRTYVGMTNNLTRRLRQHAGVLVGGAKYTRTHRPWSCVLFITGFTTKREALQFEWAWKKQPPKNVHGLEQRLQKLQHLLRRDQWTRNAPRAVSVPLVVNCVERLSTKIATPPHVSTVEWG